MLRTTVARIRPILQRCRSVMSAGFPKTLLLQTSGIAASFTLADVILQKFENEKIRKGSKWLVWLDKDRAIRCFETAIVVGMFDVFWYRFLDRRFPGSAMRIVMKKLALDFVVAVPIVIVMFVTGMKMLEGFTMRETWEGVKKEFFIILKAEVVFWPGAQAINFRFVPPAYRIMYLACVVFMWNVCLSYFHHVYVGDQPKPATIEAADSEIVQD